MERICRKGLTEGPSVRVDDAEDQTSDDKDPEDSVVKAIKVILGHCKAGKEKGSRFPPKESPFF